MKKIVRLTEIDLTRLVKRVINENKDNKKMDLKSDFNDIINHDYYSEIEPSDLVEVLEELLHYAKNDVFTPTLNSEFNVGDVITCEFLKDKNQRNVVGAYDFKVKSIDKETYDIKVCLESIKTLNKGEKINQCFVWDKNNKIFRSKDITYSLRFMKKVS